ncbi:MAG TPA: barstar family protein [Steroidobacteraceae bacterium]|nr:barstar family protein [Steroidobacteraceae bacterium]
MIESSRSEERSEAGQSVQRVTLSDERAAGIRVLAASLRYTVFEADLGGCHDKAGLLERLARAMTFPDWFGGNWDAWFDCLTDLGWHAPAPGYVLVLRHALGMHRAAPETLDTALAIVEDAARVWAERGVTLRAFVDLDGHG